jgi:general secretion pathway protein J
MMKRARGFTLIELLVAIGILAIVAVLGWRGLDGIVRARIALSEQMEVTRGMQLAFAQMQSDCEHAVTDKSLRGRPALAADSDRLTLVRNVYNDNEPSRLQVVSYRINGGVLTRRESNGTRDLVQLDALWKAATSDADPSPPVTLQQGVASMAVMVFENDAWRPLLAQPAVTPQTPAVPGVPGAGGPLGLGGVPGKAAPTGLQVALQVQGQQVAMSKSFLLGGM